MSICVVVVEVVAVVVCGGYCVEAIGGIREGISTVNKVGEGGAIVGDIAIV